MDTNNPRTVSSYCPCCGALQEIDPSQDYFTCRCCGEASPVSKDLGRSRGGYQAPPVPAQPARVFPPADQTYGSAPQKPRKKHTFWWILGWLFCFPIPLTILIARRLRMNKWVKAGIIAAGWIMYLLLGLRYGADHRKTPEPVSAPVVVTETAAPRSTPKPGPKSTPKPMAKTEPAAGPTEAPAEEEAEADAGEETPEPTPEPAGVTPEFKAAMDSYEAFFDEYCAFMKSMSEDPTDFNFLLQYADMMARYADTMEKLDEIDEDELSPADAAYYIEVMARIELKLLEAANYTS